MKKFALVVIACICTWVSQPIEQARATLCGTGAGTCFVTASGGTRAWSATATWSDTDGGSAGAFTPATGDSILITASSGASTIDGARSINALDATGFTGTLTHNAGTTITITGNDAGSPNGTTFVLPSGMTYTLNGSTSSALSFTSTSGTTTINPNSSGTARNLGNLTINGAGGTFVFGTAATVGAVATLTYTAGTLTASNVAVSVGFFVATGAGTRILNMGTNTWTVSGVGATVWDLTGTNITLNASTSTLLISSVATSERVINFGTTKSYSTVTFTNSGSCACGTFVAGSPTIATWNVNSPNIIRTSAATTVIVTNAFAWEGSSATSTIGVINNSATTVLTISSTVSSTLNWGVLWGLTYSGGGTLTATNSFSLGGLTGVTVTGPSGGGRIIGGWLLHRDLGAVNDNSPVYVKQAA